MCQVEQNQVIAVHNVSTTYHVPMLLNNQNFLSTLSDLLDLKSIQMPAARIQQGTNMWNEWIALAQDQDHTLETVTIALVGKYISLADAYISVSKSLEHAAMHCHRKVKLQWVDASRLENETLQSSPAEYHAAWDILRAANGILVPGGFGPRATEGMIEAIKWARTQKVPFLGVCLGMQLTVVEYARNVAGIEDAGSEELDPQAKNHVIVYMPEVCLSRALFRMLWPLTNIPGRQGETRRHHATGTAYLRLPGGHRVVAAAGAVRVGATDLRATPASVRSQPGHDPPAREGRAYLRR